MGKITNGDIMNELLSVKQIAVLIGVHHNTVPKMLKRGDLKSRVFKYIIEYVKDQAVREHLAKKDVKNEP